VAGYLGALALLRKIEQRPASEALDAELRQRGEGELLLDLAHELVDARRRRDRLLALQAGELGLVFLVGEVKPDRAGDDQRAADEAEDQQEVLAEEAPSPQARGIRVLLDDGFDRLHRFTGEVGSRSSATRCEICSGVSTPLWPKRGMAEQAAKAWAL